MAPLRARCAASKRPAVAAHGPPRAALTTLVTCSMLAAAGAQVPIIYFAFSTNFRCL
jgi:hypothetical protein